MFQKVIFIFFPQPVFKGPSKVEHWIGVDFARHAELFEIPKNEKKNANQAAFVMFYTQWASNCAALSPIIAELSLKYASPQFKFAKVDIGRAHTVASRHNISTSTSSKQLPTFILFKNGIEVARLPKIVDSKVISSNFTSVCNFHLYSIQKLIIALTERDGRSF